MPRPLLVEPLAVTGLGLALPLGVGAAEAWARSVAGDSAIGSLRRFEVTGGAAAAEVPPLDLADRLRFPRNAKFLSPATRAAVAAGLEAVAGSGFAAGGVDPTRIGVYTGSGDAGLDSGEFFRALAVAWRDDPAQDFAALGGRVAKLVDPFFLLRTLSNGGLALLSMELGAGGPSQNFVQSDTASAEALAAACVDLAEGRCDVALAGGYDSLLNPSTWLAYRKAGLLSETAPEAVRGPFDRGRDGLVPGEGAAFLVIERQADARGRGARVLGEIAGIGRASDGRDAPAGREAGVLAAALDQAGCDGAPLAFVVAHGAGTVAADRAEAPRLAEVGGGAPPVTAFKSQTGYLGAATAAVECALALLALGAGRIPPIARLVDPEVEADFVRGAARSIDDPRAGALVLSWSWTGQCAALRLRAAGSAAPGPGASGPSA